MDQKIDYSLHYLKWHEENEQYYRNKVSFYSNLTKPFIKDLDKSRPVLDFGCGTGLLVYALHKMGFSDVAGLDISDEQIAIANKWTSGCTKINDLEEYSKHNKAHFDTIFCMDVLEHIPREKQLFTVGLLAKMLPPGGKLVLSVPNANSSFFGKMLYLDWTHYMAFEENSLEFVVKNAGFDDIHFYPFEFYKRPRMPFIPRKTSFLWWLHKTFRAIRRLQAVSEFGEQGWQMPLGLNILAVATRRVESE